jgi:asparagine synthase (glutamine-hydrolysing)
MPGIAGLISRRSADECRRLVEQMLGRMQHESFYTSGSYSAHHLGVFAGWVALKGSFSDCQPVLSERGDVALLFSGECFSDSDTRARLRRPGHRPETRDAGWLADVYQERGDRLFGELNGTFSGLLIDGRRRRVVLFNDRYGLERIYYHEGKDGFFFASEAKALLRVLPELRAFDVQGVADFLRYGCTRGWNSLFQGIKVLPGASLWSFAGDRCEKRQYFVPETWESQPRLAPEAFEAELHETFTRILPRYFDSDDVIGISLTAGLDTRMIMACRPANANGLVSYTFAGMERDTLDVSLAARVASVCAVPHHVLRIGPDFFSDFASLADRTVYLTDGCASVCGAHEIYLNAHARELAPVRLTGNFGSEILRGMTTFKPLGLSADLFDSEVRRQLSAEQVSVTEAKVHPISFAAFKEIPWLLFGIVRAAQSQIGTRTPYLDNDLVALAFRTPEEMRRSSSPAVRLIRQNLSGLDRIPTDRGLVPASPLSSVLGSLWSRVSFKLDYWCEDGMPHWLSFLDDYESRLGTGRSWLGAHRYLHYRRWFRGELAEYLRERLTDSQTRRRHLWNTAFLEDLGRSHIVGRKNYVREINAVLTLEAIDRLLLTA